MIRKAQPWLADVERLQVAHERLRHIRLHLPTKVDELPPRRKTMQRPRPDRRRYRRTILRRKKAPVSLRVIEPRRAIDRLRIRPVPGRKPEHLGQLRPPRRDAGLVQRTDIGAAVTIAEMNTHHPLGIRRLAGKAPKADASGKQDRRTISRRRKRLVQTAKLLFSRQRLEPRNNGPPRRRGFASPCNAQSQPAMEIGVVKQRLRQRPSRQLGHTLGKAQLQVDIFR